MKISKGMYVRTKKGIGKINEIRDFMGVLEFHLDSNIGKIHNVTDNTYWNNVDDIIGEPSFNIIDLIEVGDYANGYPVVQIMDCYENDTKRDLGRTIYIDKPCAGVKIGWTPLLNGNIKDIITKEQFNSCKCVIERDK